MCLVIEKVRPGLSVHDPDLHVSSNDARLFVWCRSVVFPELFSDCSLDQLSTYLENADSSCLLEPPTSDRLYGGPVCGNSFLDLGEDCDCGTMKVGLINLLVIHI